MTSQFAAAPVLDFGPGDSGPKGLHDRWRLHLLWPAWEFRVLAPTTPNRKVNLFERAALGLCRAGVAEAAEVAKLLGFDTELAARVLHELHLKSLIDASGVLTKEGRAVLDGLDIPSEDEYAVGHVFRDAISGDLFPRIVPSKDRNDALAPAEVDDRGAIRIRRGPTGTSKLLRPFAIYPESAQRPSPLDPDEVLDASRFHRRALKSYNKNRGRGTSEGDTADDTDGVRTLSDAERERRQMQVKKIALMNDAPRPVWLYTLVHHTADAPSNPDAWTACDPFGLGDSPALLRRIHKLAQSLPPLRERIDEKTGALAQRHRDEARALDEVRHALATQAVVERLGADVPEAVMTHLRLMEVYLEMGRSGSAFLFRSAVAEAQSAAEALFGIILREANAGLIRDTLSSLSRKGRTEFMNEAAAQVGFGTPLPDAITIQSPGKAACRGKGASLRAYVAAALCDANLTEGHPLRKAAASEPSLISDLDALAEVRNEKGGHASPIPPSEHEADASAQTVYRACELLLPLL